MTPAENFLSRCEGVKQTGPGRWVFRVPTRKDKRASGSARELEDGRLLIHDFAGDSAVDMLAAVGLDLSDLYPPEPATTDHGKRAERRPFLATDALRCIGFEALVVAAAAASLREGKALPPADYDRLQLAAQRLTEAATVAGV